MSRKGENIYKRKDGRWEGRYIRCYDENSRAKYGYVYAATYSEVKQRLLEKQLLVSSGSAVQSNSFILYGDILTQWLQSVKLNIKESTYSRYYHLIENHIRPELGRYQLTRISTQLIERHIEQQLSNGNLRNGGALSPKTVSDILTIIKSTMEYARCNNFNVTCNLGKLTVKKKDHEMRVLSKSEQGALVKILTEDIDHYKFGVLLSLYTGIRIGELCALRWENISFENSTLRVRETMQRVQATTADAQTKTKVIITEPKSQCSMRDIPLPECIVDIAKRFSASPKAFILTGDMNKYIEPRTMQNRFKTYIKDSGIADANFHSLRHTFATRCVELGFEIKSLSEILGHANVNITLNRYVHSSFDLKHSNMNRLSLSA